MLVRQFVGKRLAEYYSQPSNKVVGSTPNIRLSSLWGEWHWRHLYRRLYKEQEGQWLTSVELFRPHYSNILANFVAETTLGSSTSDQVHIVELGGGRGTNASAILSHLQRTRSKLYEQVSYTIIDSSRPLLELQKEILGSGPHATKVDYVFQDLMQVAEKKASLLEESDVPTVFLAMELLDNLPHDKIRRNRVSRQFEQAEVRTSNADQLDEVFVPLEDPLLCEILGTCPSYGSAAQGRPTWIPTVACGVLAHLAKVRPNSCLAFFDFDYLPPPDLVPTGQRQSTLANGEPLITSMDEMDHECYLDAPPFCDILFPTDFPKLALVAKKFWANGARVETMKQSHFLERYGIDEVNATTSWLTGYSPLIHDFGNCSVLTVTNNNKQTE